MKIAYCFSSIYNNRGMERILLNKANYLVEKFGYDVTIITTDQSNKKTFFKLSDKIKLVDLNINYNQHQKHSRIVRYFKFIRLKREHYKKLRKLLEKEKYDIVISLMTHDIGFLYKIKDGSKKILEFHFSRVSEIIDTKQFFYKLILKIRQIFLKQIIGKYDRFVVLTNEDKDAWSPMDNISVIPNFVSFSDNRQDEISKLENKRIIAVGSLVHQKGFDMLLEAWQTINQKYPDYKLVIFGGGDPTALNKLINKYNMEKTVEIKPPTNYIREEYLKSSLFILSSRHEGFGLVLVEAMCCGLPIIAFKCPCGPKDIVKENFGILVDRENIIELGRAIERYILLSEVEKKQLGHQAYQESLKYRINNIMPLWNELFQEIIADN